MLGLGRALGETMAVTFVIGNAYRIQRVAVRARQLALRRRSPTSSTKPPTRCTAASLIALGLVLFVLTLIVLAASRHAGRAADARRRSADVSAAPVPSPRVRHRCRLRATGVGCSSTASTSRCRLRRWRSAWCSCCGSSRRCSGTASPRCRPTLFTQMTPPPGIGRRLAERDFRQRADRRRRRRSSARRSASSPASISPNTAAASWFARSTRFVNDILLSAPSIVLGLFVYTVYVRQRRAFLRLGRLVGAGADRDSGGRAHDREHAAARAEQPARSGGRARRADVEGDPDGHAQRAVRGGVITGVLLAVARISGETAPLLFTALNNQFLSTDMNAPMANLPVVIFQFAMSPFDDWQRARVGGGAADHADACSRSTSWRARCSARRRTRGDATWTATTHASPQRFAGAAARRRGAAEDVDPQSRLLLRRRSRR